MPIPVFATCFGMLQIILRVFLSIVFINDGKIDVNYFDNNNDRFTDGKVSNGLKPFDVLIAFWMLMFLLFAIVFYWFLLTLIEGRILSFCFRSITGNNAQ